MKKLSTKAHGVADYVMGATLIALPHVMHMEDKSSPKAVVPTAIGAGVIAYSMLTDYEYGTVPVISMRTHLKLDLAGGLLMAASPWLCGFHRRVWAPHLILGLAEVAASLLTETRTKKEKQAAYSDTLPTQAVDMI